MEEYTKAIASLIGISGLAAVCRLILTPERRSFIHFCRATILAIFVGGITGALIQDYHFSVETQGGVIGLCAFVADDLLLGLVGLADWFRKHPTKIIDVILNRKPLD